MTSISGIVTGYPSPAGLGTAEKPLSAPVELQEQDAQSSAPVLQTTEAPVNVAISDAARAMLYKGAYSDLTATQKMLGGSNIVAFVDSGIPDADGIVKSLTAQGITPMVIDDSSDGISQMAEKLDGLQNLSGIMIFSHGESGLLGLGINTIDTAALDAHKEQLAVIGAALSQNGDILLYGCDIGRGASGNAFVQALAKDTDADIAASLDKTGSKLLGGNWTLEVQVGQIETPIIALEDYAHVLALPATPISGLSPAEIGALTTDQIVALTSSQFAAMTSDQISALTTDQIAAIPIEGVAALKASALQTSQLVKLSTDQVVALSTAQVVSLTTGQIASLTTNQIGAIEIQDLQSLTSTQVRALKTDQLVKLSVDQIRAMNSGQVSALTTAQLAALTSAQVVALKAVGLLK